MLTLLCVLPAGSALSCASTGTPATALSASSPTARTSCAPRPAHATSVSETPSPATLPCCLMPKSRSANQLPTQCILFAVTVPRKPPAITIFLSKVCHNSLHCSRHAWESTFITVTNHDHNFWCAPSDIRCGSPPPWPFASLLLYHSLAKCLFPCLLCPSPSMAPDYRSEVL